jgi:hypothetical protein
MNCGNGLNGLGERTSRRRPMPLEARLYGSNANSARSYLAGRVTLRVCRSRVDHDGYSSTIMLRSPSQLRRCFRHSFSTRRFVRSSPAKLANAPCHTLIRARDRSRSLPRSPRASDHAAAHCLATARSSRPVTAAAFRLHHRSGAARRAPRTSQGCAVQGRVLCGSSFLNRLESQRS